MSAPPGFLPWQQDTAGAWLQNRERFAHAWLIHGLAGIGKHRFALAAAASLLCESPRQGVACGHCQACTWVASGNHPDLRRIRPDAVAAQEGEDAADDAVEPAGGTARKAPSRDIRVEQLRALHDWFNTATHRGGWRVAVLYPAEALNIISANALLKVLEEPPAHTVFLLTADAPDRLLPTLVSRCRRLPLPVPTPAQCLPWLQEQGLADPKPWLAVAGGAPLLALEKAQGDDSEACPAWLRQMLSPLAKGGEPDIGPLADQLEKQAPAIWIDALQRLFVDLSLAAFQAPVRYFPGEQAGLAAIAQRAAPERLADAAKWLASQRAVANHPLNAKLFTHAALQRVVQACGPAPSTETV
ncbi:DNA polymerase III subunit delta' [Pusillimonas noertemannii]|uniref:DNA polymerase III delta prime subunit n=1 Tax=Pusillimonas noertemannii TaxID=305977 RepID=A0A2U1CJI0_9BURK|nr:DNA polymerase III subunit delta' [Pusillimonas noertemannii]NYT69899.1 DNA polymerase III subunit delta' [Pusillimonas noertemannii]PVY61177.1 DNA polymerase III delta prime subunit [Pusillimonas noertemannii]TFL09193.1 DNA polymerase III subunit delta' [Pusillimonas noertemannii]